MATVAAPDTVHEPRASPGLVAWAITAAALPLLVLVALRGRVDLQVSRAAYLPLHTVIELLVVSTLLATFCVQWFAARAQAFRDARARFLGPALLAGAAFEALHYLTFPGMAGLFGPSSTERGITYWLAARTWVVGAMFVTPFIPPTSAHPLLRRWPLLAFSSAAVVAVVGFDLSSPHDRAHFFVEGQGLTRIKLALEGGVALAAAVGAALHGGRAWRTGERALGRLAGALALSALAGACFTLYATAYDAFNVLGHVYLLGSAALAFDALFLAALVKPYAELDALRAHVEGELQVTIAELKQRTEQRDDLLRAVSHDLRSPLQVVVLQASRLARPAEGERGRLGEAILAAGRRMDRMLRDVADLARLDGGMVRLERRPVALRPAVADLLAQSEGALDAARVTNAVPEELPALDADPDQLDRILLNLVGNALKYTAGAVWIAAAADAGLVRVSVRDEGPGIDPADLPRLFERYYRGHARRGDGLGLGLFIVRRLVEAHGGRVDVESGPSGSTFAFTVPVAARAAPRASA